jgi:adenine-specific DNA-methyltransferase
MGMDSAKLAARAKQPGHDQSFRRSELDFVSALESILDLSEWEVVDHPRDLRRIIGGRYGVVPEAMIRNHQTGNRMFFEVKKQGPTGNADERACKHHTVQFYSVLERAFGYSYHPFVTIMCESLATDPRYTTKHPYFYAPDQYFCWVNYDLDILADYLARISDMWLRDPNANELHTTSELDVIKYLGSKRTLTPILGDIAEAVEAQNAVDLFTGTTRVAQEFKRRGIWTTACDIATYSEILAKTYVETDASSVNKDDLAESLEYLAELPGYEGYFTRTFCVESRFFMPKNGERVDAIRDALEQDFKESNLYPILLTALMLAADRVDSTTGVQMAYLKEWAPRANNDLDLRAPELLAFPGRALRGDALDIASALDPADLVYLDPPYNQHRYFTNYHIWETLVRWDAPRHYGVACKRVDSREQDTKSIYNRKREMPAAFQELIRTVRTNVLIISYNDESWITAETMLSWLHEAGYEDVRLLAYDRKRYVGAQIGIFNPSGKKVGKVSHLRNTEYIFVAGTAERVEAAAATAGDQVRGRRSRPA